MTTVAKPSGIAATANATAVINASLKLFQSQLIVTISKIKTTTQIARAIIPITFPTLFSLCCNGVKSSFCSLSILAILPISVDIPTLVTIAFAFPFVT